jgi:hypothetical protein
VSLPGGPLETRTVVREGCSHSLAHDRRCPPAAYVPQTAWRVMQASAVHGSACVGPYFNIAI